MARFRPARRLQLPESIDGVLSFLSQMQEGVVAAFATLSELPLVDFVWKRDVVLTAGSNSIGHGLGRPWRGYIVTRRNAPATVHDPDEQPIRDRVLTLESTGNAVVDLFVF